VRRVSLVADRASPVRLTFGPGRVLIEAQTEGRARAVETVPADFRGEEPVIAFNPHYLLDGLVAAAVPGQSRPHAGEADGTGGTGGGMAPGSGATGSGRTVSGAGDSGAAAGTGPGGTPPADPGLLRIEFTSPAKPALITRVYPRGEHDDPDAGREEAEFRYLVVPLRAAARA
jgi:DNA polymerase III beta subunit, C-terminal domain